VKVLVLGGYGHFGAAISERLAGIEAVEVVVAGRDEGRAHAFAQRISASSARIDARAADLAERIARTGAHMVISTAGPFVGAEYRVARAALAAGADYVDIADGRAFVCGIHALDGEARARGRLVVSGASSVPALTSAVVDRHREGFASLGAIEVGICASATMPGEATTRSVLGYCGRGFRGWRDGREVELHGWMGLRRHVFAEPPMARWLADCDVPDLELFRARYRGVRTVAFGAGVEAAPVQLGLWLLAGLVRAGVVRDIAPFATGLHRAATWLEWLGTGRSAMFVRLSGIGADFRALERTWELRARNGDGAHIPGLAAVALVRKRARGALVQAGAMPCLGLVTLEEYLAEAAGLAIAASLLPPAPGRVC
jgi:hypothetical protein